MNSKKSILQNAPKIRSEPISLLSILSNSSSVSGDEKEVRNIVVEQLKDLATNIKIDALGNVIAFKKGKGEALLNVMLVANMDEIGLMVTVEEQEGLYQFEPVGEVDIRQLPGKSVKIGRDHISAVIGARAIHLTTSEQRRTAIPLDTLRLDVGLGNAGGNVKIGDRVAFATQFHDTETSLFGKALDNRLGVVTLIEILRNSPENIDIFAVFSTQEKLNSRGAWVATYSIDPDIAIRIDASPANDFPANDQAEENLSYETKIGQGPAISFMQRTMISDPRLIAYFKEIGDAYQIPYQLSQPTNTTSYLERRLGNGIKTQREGIPYISLATPVRYPGTAASIALKSDWENTWKLLYCALSELDAKILSPI